MHATWNALLRSASDRLRSIVIMNITSAATSLPFALALPPAHRASWPYLCCSLFLQVSYCFLLERAYRTGDLSRMYPIMRGIAPLLVSIGAATTIGEKMTTLSLAGVATVSCGIFVLALEPAKRNIQSVLAAAGAGVFIAAFTLVDGLGARLSMNAIAYALWLFILQGIAMPLCYITSRGHLSLKVMDHETAKAIVGGLLALLAYGSIIVALTLWPMGQVAALRELSIVFASAIGFVFLKEPLTLRRVGAAIIITAGAIVLATGH
jgi:drug/metabolite transporter (DMT)-like permease